MHAFTLSRLGVFRLAYRTPGIGAAIVCLSLFENGSLWFKYFLIDSIEFRDSHSKWTSEDHAWIPRVSDLGIPITTLPYFKFLYCFFIFYFL